MADVATSSVEPQSSPKTTIKKDKKLKTDRPKASHPSTAIMVNNAIQNLKERGGSSLQAIKKYISATYKIDAEKCSPFIKKYLKSSVVSGSLVQTKGKGASGSFKLASTAVTKKSVSQPKKASGAATKTTARKTTKAKVVKTTNTGKKSTIAAAKSTKTKKVVAAATTLEKRKSTTTTKVVKPKSPSKAKKTTKAPTKKPKSPKPKTTKPKALKKKASPKKK